MQTSSDDKGELSQQSSIKKKKKNYNPQNKTPVLHYYITHIGTFTNADSALDLALVTYLPTIKATCGTNEELLSDELGHLGLDIATVTQAPKHGG